MSNHLYIIKADITGIYKQTHLNPTRQHFSGFNFDLCASFSSRYRYFGCRWCSGRFYQQKVKCLVVKTLVGPMTCVWSFCSSCQIRSFSERTDCIRRSVLTKVNQRMFHFAHTLLAVYDSELSDPSSRHTVLHRLCHNPPSET